MGGGDGGRLLISLDGPLKSRKRFLLSLAHLDSPRKKGCKTALCVLYVAGVPAVASSFVVPMATGMTLMLCMLAFKTMRREARYVLWPRIDQKSCFKAIVTAGEHCS